MNRIGTAAPLCLTFIMTLAGCTSVQYQAERMEDHIGLVTREEVALYFGEPLEVRPLEGGGEEWVYQYIYTTHGGTAVVGRRTCWENVLTFDKKSILRGVEKHLCSKEG